ncbi:cytochrome c oxidase subunit 4 [Timonella senegalensis]|uniref:cytochrome c oxidase subunit 4 n=1 Tax=Timonella senegalensis TaxID=1465825 RepID=UPI0002E24E16|nr:cytochrome c oxidase subunit 4 [Timonella senegalensis]
MKIEANIFVLTAPFFFVVGLVYGLVTGWEEPVGFLALFLCSALMAMVGWYLLKTARHIDARPEDDPYGEIAQGAGEQGFYSPWSWWPIVVAGGAAICFLGMAIGWWIFGVGVVISIIALVGWVFEYSRGTHAH